MAGAPIVVPAPPNYGNPRLDSVGKTYIAVLTLWTVTLSAGLVVFLRHRHMPFIRLRNVPLVCFALGMIHLQLIFDMLMYPLNGSLSCSLEFWIMNICLPLGIAAFQTNNWVLFSRAWGQKHLLYLHSKNADSKDEFEQRLQRCGFFRRNWYRWCRLCILKKMYLLVAGATLIQFVVALTIFLLSRRFHAKYGPVGQSVTRFECRAGWEWIPSGIWQAVWTYGFGPFILFKIRKIQDTHHWRLQTTLAILFSLPALPLWLATWWLPEFYIMNTYWPPNLWFVPGLASMQFIILCFPLMELYSFAAAQHAARLAPLHSKFSAYSPAALSRALAHDIDRLEAFAATKDLTGENIVFLRRVARWRALWEPARAAAADPARCFAEARDIWATLVDRDAAAFPLNLEHDIYTRLQWVFGRAPAARRSSASSRAQIAPFADDVIAGAEKTAGGGCDDDEDDEVRGFDGQPGFGENVFDRAEAAVRQMVLENTWIRYVNSLPDDERSRIGVGDAISLPLSRRWRSFLWRKDAGAV
ncbi:hypothetical protein EDC01DRAFT_223876 [Geopyxis carbonaria]|nr:hypothetical protein EDC01DRAFT_223876 [Geopyxis carbonaria]